jgi:curved DNA-binding protein CbpA
MPPPPEKTPYDILGVPRTASAEEIKRRYRELARQHHPDVNPNNPSAARLFADISSAYKTLTDADSRRLLDAELALLEQRSRQAASSRFTSPPRSSSGPTPTTRPAGGTAAAANAEAVQLTSQAQAAFARGKFVEARSFAEQALRLNKRNAAAYEVLGDVFRLQGKTEEAMDAYTMALQLNPRNTQIMQRLERLARASGTTATAQRAFYDNSPRPGAGPPPGYTSGRPGPAPSNSSRPATGRVSRISEEKRPWGMLLAGAFGYGGVLMMILWGALYHGNAPLGTPLLSVVSTWNGTIVTLMALCGLLLGGTMTITQAIRRIDDELIFTGVGRGGAYMPLGILLVVVSLLNFYVAAIFYTIISLVQESLTPSLMRVFGAVVTVVLLLGAIYEPGHLQVLTWGGNVVFVAFLVGWLLGDFFRPDNY